jgi:hypothetical protein
LSIANVLVRDGQIVGIATGAGAQSQPLAATVWLEPAAAAGADLSAALPLPTQQSDLAIRAANLIAVLPPGTAQLNSAVDTLTLQLAQTLGFNVTSAPQPARALATAWAAFATSDEHGFLPINGTKAVPPAHKQLASQALANHLAQVYS